MKSKEHKEFQEALEKVLSVTHAEIKRLESNEKTQRTFTSKKRGRKATSPALRRRVLGERD
jgi:hypothetical protein